MLDKNIQSASEDLGKLFLDEHALRTYELREKALRDERSNLWAAREEGLAKGRKEGREEGREEGIQEGIRLLVKTMAQKGLNDTSISEITGLSQEEIARLLEI